MASLIALALNGPTHFLVRHLVTGTSIARSIGAWVRTATAAAEPTSPIPTVQQPRPVITRSLQLQAGRCLFVLRLPRRSRVIPRHQHLLVQVGMARTHRNLVGRRLVGLPLSLVSRRYRGLPPVHASTG